MKRPEPATAHCKCCLHSPAHDPEGELQLALHQLSALEIMLAQAEDVRPDWIALLLEPIRLRLTHVHQTLNQEHTA